MPAPLLLAMAPSLIQAAGGLAGFGQQQKELARQRSESQKIQAQQEAAAKAARAALPEYTVGRAGRQAYMMSQQDRAGDIAQEKIQQAQGAGLGALQAGGARALIGGAAAMAGQSARDAEEAAVRADQRRMAGQQAFAAQEQQALDANVAAQRELGLFDYGRALQTADQERALARQLGADEQANKMALTQDLFSAGAGAAGVLGGIFNKPSAKDGAKIKETPGEFSHATNPIHLVRNGIKVGEATGGELIFNPEQSGKLETLATEGDTELHKYLRGLFKKFNKKS
jgi:hypothetical protein